MELVRRGNERSLAALQRRLAAASKQTSKHLKKEYRTQRQEICETLEQQRGNLTSEQEREALRQVKFLFNWNITFLLLLNRLYGSTNECSIKKTRHVQCDVAG